VILQYSFEGSVWHITIRWWYKKAFPPRLESCCRNFPDIPERAFFPRHAGWCGGGFFIVNRMFTNEGLENGLPTP